MKKISLLFLFLIPYLSYSQTLEPEAIFSATGNHNVAGYAQISWTLGDNQVTTLKNPQAVMTQGFIQTKITITGINRISDSENINIKFFPNPVKDILQIQVESQKPVKFFLNLYSVDGKLILSKEVEPSEKNTQIDFTSYQKGLYILNFTSENRKSENNYRIIYQE